MRGLILALLLTACSHGPDTVPGERWRPKVVKIFSVQF